MIIFTEGSVNGFLLITLLYLVGAILAKSKLLSMFSALALSTTIGALTAYDHASYYLIIQQPGVTIVLFTVLAWASYQLSKRVVVAYEPTFRTSNYNQKKRSHARQELVINT